MCSFVQAFLQLKVFLDKTSDNPNCENDLEQAMSLLWDSVSPFVKEEFFIGWSLKLLQCMILGFLTDETFLISPSGVNM